MKTIKLKDILSISGKGGLYRFIAQARNGVVVQALEDGKRHVAPANARVSSLEDIAIFTKKEEVPLSDVFMLIHEKQEGGEALSHKSSPEELKGRFKELVPEYDEDRVYVSDIRKVFLWYNQLQAHDLLEVIEKEEEKETVEAEKQEGGETPEEKVKPGESTGKEVEKDDPSRE